MILPSAPQGGRTSVSRPIAATLLLLALLAVAVPVLVVLHPPHIPAPRRVVRMPERVVPPAELPPVEPVRFQDLAPDDARAFNADVPFVDGPIPAARPFRYVGSDEDLARATDCLAAAEIYEAGDDTTGEKAVAQVVLNRLRHPAFPKTVCGVVFQGSERTTGCQFTFTCDGALTRWTPSAAAWDRARQVATMALKGTVDRPIGYATHYHTDWVVPYWSSSLDKIAQVGTHLFFRWTGWWGTPPAFNRRLQPGEPIISQLARFSPAHETAAALQETAVVEAQAIAASGALTPLATDSNTFLVTIDPATPPDTFPTIAQTACGARDYCKVMMWTDQASTGTALPLDTAQVAAMAFSYVRDHVHDYERLLWNCQRFARAQGAQCMKRQVLIDTPASVGSGNTIPPVAASPARAPLPDPLIGVRRKLFPTPLPTTIRSANPKPGIQNESAPPNPGR